MNHSLELMAIGFILVPRFNLGTKSWMQDVSLVTSGQLFIPA
ncbi:hypothetical protein [Aerosakkonema funiforme]|nr:hypothetical protein [Aerosakkonema funiforme]